LSIIISKDRTSCRKKKIYFLTILNLTFFSIGGCAGNLIPIG